MRLLRRQWIDVYKRQPEKHAVVKSDRGDGRLLSTYAIVHEMLKETHPQYAYRSGMSAQDFTQWQDGVRAAMVEIMKFPEIKGQQMCIRDSKNTPQQSGFDRALRTDGKRQGTV